MSLCLTPFVTLYLAVLAALLGAIMGSFLNCAAIRMVHGESIVRGRSHCTHCGHLLGAAELVPVFSYLFLRGRCRWCGQKISPRYLIAELVGAAVYLLTLFRWGLTLQLAEMLLLSSILLAVSFADLEAGIIPDRLLLLGIICRVPFILLSGDIGAEALQSLIGGLSISVPVLVLVLVMEKLLKKDAMGGGDIKLLFMVGIYFHWTTNLVGLVFACVLGIAFGLAARKKDENGQFPFGPAVACGSWLAMLFGYRLIAFYAGLFSL